MVTRLLIIFIIITIKACAQDYIPFPVDNTIWGTEWGCQDIQNEKIYRYTLSGEKLIEGVKYCELQVKLATFNPNSLPEVNTYELDPAYYREENKKIYFYNKRQMEDILYYDFNLNIGDTFVYQKYDTLVVIEKTIQFEREGLILQTLNNSYLDYYWTETWIQGIGSLSGLMSPIGEYGCSGTLDCFVNGDFSPLDCSRNYHYLDIEETYKEIFTIAPNPASSKVNIRSNQGKITKISIVSIFGGQELLNSDYINSDNYIIDVSHFQSGIYILTINSNNNLISKKLIIK